MASSYAFTDRELEVLREISRHGDTNQEIAETAAHVRSDRQDTS